jgi:N-acylneuraminate cytidylyltransferase
MAEGKFGEVLALIPARGGSKSVPRKNIIPLFGKPMIAWAIEHALASRHITRVIVTTDDDEIAEVARQYGAETPFMRPSELAGDLSLDVEFHKHAVDWLKENEGYVPDMIVNLRPTPPSRDPDVIDEAIELFAAHPEVDALRSVHLAEQTPFKMWVLDGEGYMRQAAVLDGVSEPYNQPRQKLPLVYWQDGYVDITRPEVITQKNSTTGNRILPFFINEPAADVDYPNEVGIAEAQLRGRRAPDGESAEKRSDNTTIRHPS